MNILINHKVDPSKLTLKE